MNNARYGTLTTTLLAGWFLLALTASAFHLFQTAPGALPLPIALAFSIPLLVFLSWFAFSAGFRHFILSLNPRTLTMVQAWRIGGFTFLVLYAHGILPGTFALPAGWGDIAVGATAPLVAMKLASPHHRKSFIAWQVLGMLDLVLAVTLGALAPFIHPEGITTAAMTILPLSLIPTFAVPLLLMLHIASITQARQWPKRGLPDMNGPLAASGA